MHRQIILDTETTGLDTTRNHKIIEIGCIEIIDRKYTGKDFHFYLNPKRKQRLELIYNLYLKGWSNKQISDHLNSKNLKTPRTKKEYTPKLIWMTIHKYKKRLFRKSNRILRIKESINVSLPFEKNSRSNTKKLKF